VFELKFNLFEVALLLFMVALASAFVVIVVERRRVEERINLQREIDELRAEIKTLQFVINRHFPNELARLEVAV